MEMNAIMQALVKDLAEQLRPLVNEQIATWAKDNLLVSLARMEDNLDEKIKEHFSDNLRDGIIEHLDDSLLTLIVDKIDMVRRARGQTDVSSDGYLADLAHHLTRGQLEIMARHVNMAELATELSENFADDIAEHISLSDLASEINLENLANELDMEDSIKSFFSDNQATISF
jgi:aryl-alcohol dehydrogenase-like predicted oxidoreductase